MSDDIDLNAGDDANDELTEFAAKHRRLQIRVTQLTLECESLSRAYDLLAQDYARVIADNERWAARHKTVYNENTRIVRILNGVRQLAAEGAAEVRSARTETIKGSPTLPDSSVVQFGAKLA